MPLNAVLFLGMFFSLSLEIFLEFLKYFSLLSVISVAAEFQFFTCIIAIVSSYNRGIMRPILGRVGAGAPCLFVIGI